MKIGPVGTKSFHTDGQKFRMIDGWTNRQTDRQRGRQIWRS